MSNKQLKDQTKQNLDTIRSLLHPNDADKVEPYLRQILLDTKALMLNVRVDPSEHQGLISQNVELRRKSAELDGRIAELIRTVGQRDQELAKHSTEMLGAHKAISELCELQSEICTGVCLTGIMYLYGLMQQVGSTGVLRSIQKTECSTRSQKVILTAMYLLTGHWDTMARTTDKELDDLLDQARKLVDEALKESQ